MIRPLFPLFFSFFICCTLYSQQPAPSLQAFHENIAAGKPSYISLTLEKPNFFGVVIDTPKVYYELLEDEEQWFFYKHSYGELVTDQQICQCELEELQGFLSAQITADTAGTQIEQYLQRFPFTQEDCIANLWADELTDSSAVLKKILKSELKPIQYYEDTLEVDIQAQMLRCEDGRWVLDLEVPLPGDYEINRFWGLQLFHVRSGSDYYYPAPEIPKWKARLVRNEFYTGRYLSSKSAEDSWEEISFRAIETENSKHRPNYQILFPANSLPSEEKLEVRGSINILVTNGKIRSAHQAFPTFEPGKSYRLELDDKGTLSIEELGASNSLGYWFHYDTKWDRIVFYEAEGDTLARFEQDMPAHKMNLHTAADKTYKVHLTGEDLQAVQIPFELEVSTVARNRQAAKNTTIKREYWRYAALGEGQDGEKIKAVYHFRFQEDQPVDTFILQKVYDNTGKDLLVYQVDSLESYLKQIKQDKNAMIWSMGSTYGDLEKGYVWQVATSSKRAEKQYELQLSLWDQPQAKATAIYLEGELYQQTINGQLKRVPWRDTLQLGLPSPFTEPRQVMTAPASPSPLSAKWFSLGDVYQTYYQGLRAGFEFAIPPNHVFVNIIPSKSQLLSLQDNTGQDLLLQEKAVKSWNVAQNKSRQEPYEYNYYHLTSQGSLSFGSSGASANFIVRCNAAPNKGATQIRGKAEVAYRTFDHTQLSMEQFNIPYTQQEEIELVVEGQVLRYERSIDSQEIGGKTYRTYYLQASGLPMFIGASSVFYQDKYVGPDPDSVFPFYHLYVPEDYQGEELQIGITYAPYLDHKSSLDFEVSLQGVSDWK